VFTNPVNNLKWEAVIVEAHATLAAHRAISCLNLPSLIVKEPYCHRVYPGKNPDVTILVSIWYINLNFHAQSKLALLSQAPGSGPSILVKSSPVHVNFQICQFVSVVAALWCSWTPL
jgi:hypothetical protein